jgi:two-component system chemotaxis sensor kinase CheA
MIDRQKDAYREEAAELLAELEGSLLELEEQPEDPDLVGRVFRALHTIKGSGAMFGFDAIAGFTHELETAFDNVREGRIPITPELVGVTLDARDHIQSLLRASASEAAALAPAGNAILERLRQVTPGSGADGVDPPRSAEPIDPPEQSGPRQVRSFRIRFEPAPDILLTGANPILLLRELGQLGECSLTAHRDRIPELSDFNPEQCYTSWDAVLTTSADENAIRDVFIFVEDQAQLTVQQIGGLEAEQQRARLGDLLVERGDVPRGVVEEVLEARPRAGELLVQAGLVSQDRVDAAVLEQRHRDALREKRQKEQSAASLRVPAVKLDSLVNIVGELVTVQARLSSYAAASGNTEVSFIAEEVERLAELLRESTMSIRMLPIGETFSRFKRLVRDLSSELGKKVELVTEGNDTELDKTVVEQLSDPLVHLVRNAVDHGIELPDRRLASGKAAMGKIRLSASHAGAYVLIRVADDGAGMDLGAIRSRAIERGLIAADAVLSEQEIYALVLSPGFSTASQVTEISGRGVGMDVVQRSLEALRGSLSVASTPGAGTVVTLKIPLTLAMIDGLLVEAAGAFFVVPLSNISECIELSRDGSEPARQSLVTVRDRLVPYIALRERFALPGNPPRIEQVIIAETHDGEFGFVVDRVIGDHHTVIKKLGTIYRHVDEVSGATILGDGAVALVLDVEKLAAGVIRENRKGSNGR